MTPNTQAPEHLETRKLRDRRFKLAVFTSILVKPLAMLIPLIAIPIFLRYLGSERYGLYESISALAVWVTLTNIGLGFGLLNRLIECHVNDDRNLAREYVSTFVSVMLAIAGVGVIVITVIAVWLPWGSIFNASNQVDVYELRWAVWLALAIPLVSMTFSVSPIIYGAFQETHRQNIWDAVAKVASVSACLLVPLVGFGIPGAILAITGVPVIMGIVNHVHMWGWVKPWIRPRLSFARLTHIRSLLGEGFAIFLLQTSGIMLFQIDRIIIGLIRTPEEVTSYAVVQRLFLLAYGGFVLILGPLWPAYGEAARRGDVEWCRSKLRLSCLWGTLVVCTMGILAAMFNEQIAHFAGGGESLELGIHLILAMAVGGLARMWAESHSILLNGIKVIKPQITLLVITAVLTVCTSIVLTHYFGIFGTAWSYPIVSVVTTTWAYPMLARHALGKINPSIQGRPAN